MLQANPLLRVANTARAVRALPPQQGFSNDIPDQIKYLLFCWHSAELMEAAVDL